jgi:hypothetical protein
MTRIHCHRQHVAVVGALQWPSTCIAVVYKMALPVDAAWGVVCRTVFRNITSFWDHREVYKVLNTAFRTRKYYAPL